MAAFARSSLVLLLLSLSSSVIAQTTTDKVTLGGDLRVREEVVDNSIARENYRTRIRARLSAKASINEKTTALLRLATGSGATQTTSNQDLDDAGAKKDFLLDIASIEYKPNESTTVNAGKNPNPFYVPGKTELLWDGDLTFEGLNISYGQNIGNGKGFANLSYMIVDERADASQDSVMYGAQLGYAMNLSDSTLTVAVGNYSYKLIEGQPSVGVGAKGNTLAGGVYAEGYVLTDVGIEWTSQAVGLPYAVYTQAVENSESDYDDNAVILGFRVGQLKALHDWMFTYDYRRVDSDAILATMGDSDFAGGNTDARGHRYSFQYGAADNTTVGVTYFANTTSIAADLDKSYERGMLDLVVKF